MGCDIHTLAQRKTDDGYVDLEFKPFDWRSYGMFGFLADVRNYSAVPPISKPRGLPEDLKNAVVIGGWDSHDIDLHSLSWLSVAELVAFDYDQLMEDRRVTRQVAPGFFNGVCTADEGEGEATTFRAFLAERFFEDLQKLVELGADRVVFGFDN